MTQTMRSSHGGWGLTPGTHVRTYVHTTDTFKLFAKTCTHANMKLTPGAQLTQTTE